MRVRRVEVAPSGGDAATASRSRAPFALAGEGLEGGESEVVLRRHLLQPRVEHRLEPVARQREGVDGGAKRERDRIACGFLVPLAANGAAPPGEPQRRQIGIARAPTRLADFVIEACERQQSVAGLGRRVERAEPLVAGVGAGELGAMLSGFRQRRGAERTGRGHGAAISAAATRRSSDCMTL